MRWPPQFKCPVVKPDRRDHPVTTGRAERRPVLEEGCGLREDQVLGTLLIAQQQDDYVVIAKAVLYPQVRLTTVMDF
jgi:hypothetical protein